VGLVFSNYSVFCVSICTPSLELKIWNARKTHSEFRHQNCRE